MEHNQYLFDKEKKTFTAEFEKMYQAENDKGFDSWSQDEMSLAKKIDLAILENYNFQTVLDMGCGKGYFTQLLKKINNKVFGIDVSPTAINQAKSRYPYIGFDVLDMANYADAENYLEKLNKQNPVDLIVSRAVLYYLSNWGELLKLMAKNTKYTLIGLNIPPNTILHISSIDSFLKIFKENFEVVEFLEFKNRTSYTLLGKSLF